MAHAFSHLTPLLEAALCLPAAVPGEDGQLAIRALRRAENALGVLPEECYVCGSGWAISAISGTMRPLSPGDAQWKITISRVHPEGPYSLGRGIDALGQIAVLADGGGQVAVSVWGRAYTWDGFSLLPAGPGEPFVPYGPGEGERPLLRAVARGAARGTAWEEEPAEDA